MEERLEETLQGFEQTFLPLAPTFIVINDHKEEEVETKIVKPEVELKQSTNFSSKPVQEGFFEVFKHVLSQPHFEASVRMKLTFPKVGTWSPLGLPKTQSLIARVKQPCI
jgi:hypothetical protein